MKAKPKPKAWLVRWDTGERRVFPGYELYRPEYEEAAKALFAALHGRPGCTELWLTPLYAREDILELHCAAIREACTMCNNGAFCAGPDGSSIECEFCGRPIAALRKLENEDGHRNA